ncbi:MAG: hypothetical protein GXP26_04595 [Planctomycetes bacterium]|nr:hypothetical protein [Planctomycetota bacterium]
MKSRMTFANQRRTSRQASVLVCVLVCLAIATALVSSTVRTALDARRAMRTQHQLRQTELLLAAGIQRATRQLKASADYTGETWDLLLPMIPNIESAQVKIDLPPVAEDSSRKVRVTARLSVSANRAIQRSYSFSVDPN